MVVYLNGKFLPATEAKIPVTDGGFLYGDGVYTTLRLYDGRPLDLNAHVRRLGEHCLALELPQPLSTPQMQRIIERLVVDNKLQVVDSRVRITISRGSHSLSQIMPLCDLEKIEPTVLVMTGPLPESLKSWQDNGISVICLGPIYARGNLPQLKTLNILPSLLALRQATQAGCAEALLTDEQGLLLEGAFSNLFLVDDRGLCTPTGVGFLSGRTRQRIMNLAAQLGMECRECDLDKSDLTGAHEVFLSGSVREILPVVQIDGVVIGSGGPGPLTRRIQKRYRQVINDALADHQDH